MKKCVQSQIRFWLAAVLLGCVADAQALEMSKLPGGANHDGAHMAPHGSTGAGIKVGVIEVFEGVNPAKTLIDDDGRLAKNLNFRTLSAPVGAEPANVGAGGGAPLVSDHATLVAEVIGSAHSVYTGVAPGSSIYSAATNNDNSIFASIEYYSRVESVGIFNMSLGGPTEVIVDTSPHRNGVQILNNAGDTADITTVANAFDFTGQMLPTQLDELTIRLYAEDGDTGLGLIPPGGGPPPPNDFDYNNLQLKLDGVVLPFNINFLYNGIFTGDSYRFGLTPDQSAAILAELADNKLLASLRRIEDRPDTDSPLNDNTGNRIEFADAAGPNGSALLRFVKYNQNGNTQLSLALDRIAIDRDLLIVKSAGNTGAGSAQITSPGDFLNGITVGATDSSMHARARFSAYHLAGDTGAAPDLGHKPEILAPGTAIISQSISAAGDTSGTSFAAPHVAGAASLLAKGTETTPGLPLGTTVDNHLAVKAILLNSTRKRYISEPENSEQMAEDFGGTANEDSDFNYLNDDGSLRFVKNFKTAEWTPSSWEIVAPGGAQPFFSTNRPLDDEQGTGLLDAERALIQLDGGEQAPGPVSKIGWHRGVLSPGGEVDYMLNTLIPKGAFITATLVWDRIVDVTESDGSPSDNVFESTDIYAAGALPDFDLELLFQGEKIAESVAVDGTLEHLHIPAVDFGEVLDYTLRVKLFSLEASSYSLAWWTVPEPSCAGLLAIAVFAAGWRRNEIIGRG